MLPQSYPPTKCFPRIRLFQVLLPLFLIFLLCAPPAGALVKMSTKTIDAALIYGMQNQKLGLSNMLGPNWVEGENGALLNIYSPFMVLATRVAKDDFPTEPSASDLKKAKAKHGRHVAFYSDPKNRLEVKFAVNFYGNSPTFAKEYNARIVGFGRGKEVELKPAKQYLSQRVQPVSGGSDNSLYEAINSYYFRFNELENLQEFRLILESPTGPPVVFRLNNEKIY